MRSWPQPSRPSWTTTSPLNTPANQHNRRAALSRRGLCVPALPGTPPSGCPILPLSCRFSLVCKGPGWMLGACGLRLEREAEDFCSHEGLVVFEHAEDGVQELAHDSHQGLEFGFAARQEVLVKAAEVRFVLR